ncbi:unnamed protein product [Closterium sp. NIES-64]|nr:unnamed protein product [Closterium sp. NIES-64]
MGEASPAESAPARCAPSAGPSVPPDGAGPPAAMAESAEDLADLLIQCARYGDMEDVAAALDGGADAGVADDEGRTGEAGECGWGDEGRTGEAGECGWGDEGRTGEAGECGWGDEGRTGEAGECGWGDEGRTGEAGECGWGDEGRTGGGGGMRGAQVEGWSEGRIDWGGADEGRTGGGWGIMGGAQMGVGGHTLEGMTGAQCAMRTFSAAHVVTSFPHPLPVPCVHTWHNPFPHPLPVPRMNASLHMAAANGHTEIARLLMQRGAVSVFPSTAPSSLALPPWPSPLGPPPLAHPTPPIPTSLLIQQGSVSSPCCAAPPGCPPILLQWLLMPLPPCCPFLLPLIHMVHLLITAGANPSALNR